MRRFSARRITRGVVCEISLSPDTSLNSATAWLTRGGLPVASASTRHGHGKRVALQMVTGRRLRGGRYELTVATKDRHGHTEYKREKLVLH